MIKKSLIILMQSLQTMFDWLFVEWRRFRIGKGEVVADFGSGDRPFLRANILVDKSLEGSRERPDGFLDNGAYIVKCNLDKLPFKDKSLDFIYSSHTLEHLEFLKESLEEINRVGKKGYINCPSKTREGIISPRSHLWMIEKEKGVLVFSQKKNPYPEIVGNFFERKVIDGDGFVFNILDNFFKDDFFINYFWENRIKFKIKKTFNEVWDKNREGELPGNRPGLLFAARRAVLVISGKIVRIFFSRKIDLLPILCCPECKSNLIINDEKVICLKCNRLYSHRDKRVFNFIDK